MSNQELMELGDNNGLSFLETSRIFDTMLGFDCVLMGTEEQLRECFTNTIVWMTSKNDKSLNLSTEYFISASLFKTYRNNSINDIKKIDEIEQKKKKGALTN